MAFLLDTHTFLWFLSGDKAIPRNVKSKLVDLNEPCFISIASFWEIAIKQQIGKLILDISIGNLFEYAERNLIKVVPITPEHLTVLSKLPLYHGDPFDRLIIAQTIAEEFTLISKDKGLKRYKIKQVWS